MPLDTFHPAVSTWFRRVFPAPTPAQEQAWPAIAAGRHTLIAAPTGSGKTLAAFLAALDDLVRRGQDGALPDETLVVYVSPLKALSNDVQANLELPLAGIGEELARRGFPEVAIRTMVRTGDTPQAERAAMRKCPPHIVVTTPESLYILLGSESGRRMLETTRTVIVDEIHALAPNKRGAHLALSLERLDALCGRRLQRIGLSATQKPIDEVARFLTGAPAAGGERDCAIVDTGHARARDLAIELPEAPLEAVMSGDVRGQMYARLEALIGQHRTTLVFVNTRRMAERVARHLSEHLGRERVMAHHGSMAREHRLDAEQRLKRGELSALVATASLELGIDIGDVELVCQIGSPRSIAAFLQRAGRAGHQVGGLPKARLFPESRDDLVECAALLDAVRRGELDALSVEAEPLDVLAQQIVAEVACQDWGEQELYDCLRRAQPFAALTRERFTQVLRMLAEGFSTRRGPRSAWLHRDAVNGVLRAARGARLTALTSGGAIPDTADYEVVLEPESFRVGTVNEDFAVESLAGDVFQLGNQSYRILRVERGRVRVEDAKGAPPSIPFWLGEAPGRSDELSRAVARLREEVAGRLAPSRGDMAAATAAARAWLQDEVGLGEAPARQLADYLASAQAALGLLPTQDVLVLERFFDEAGGMQLVIHSPHGSRLNRAWGLALRKRFCRSFNFELQAAATEDAIVLSLSTSHSFSLEEVARYLHSASAEEVLVQALLDAPMFGVRWRWNAVTALALPRWQGGKPVPPQLQRMKAEDLLAGVFPDQVACLENIVGERQIPDHPLVAQTLHDCLRVAMDVDGFVALLRRLEAGEARVVARDLAAPSPLAAEVLAARPYAYLDDAPLEERRTQAVASRGLVDPARADDLGRLDPEAIDAVRGEAWPEARSADELHAALLGIGFVTEGEAAAAAGWPAWLDALAAERRVTRLALPGEAATGVWVPAERLPQFDALMPQAVARPPIAAPAEYAATAWTPETALADLLRARLTALGPVPASRLAASLGIADSDVDIALAALEREGGILRGRFSAAALDAGGEMEWCERHLLARIHRYTVQRLRREIEPVEPRDFMRFLFDWQHVAPGAQLRGPDALAAALAALEGYEAAAAAWEGSILPARIADYDIAWLDQLCQSGRIAWLRLRAAGGATGAGPVRATPIVLVPRRQLERWIGLAGRSAASAGELRSRAQAAVDHLATRGASFFEELQGGTRLLDAELQEALGQLVAAGLVHADGFSGLRALVAPARATARRRGRGRLLGLEDAGRWALLPRVAEAADGRDAEAVEHVVRVLLRRYGVICWRLLANEAPWLPPWRELLRVCHRLEARGEIRGGRFIAGISGEQFALPEAVAALRQVRRRGHDGQLVCISGADPLNLVGTLLAGERLPRLANARVLYRDGMPVATRSAGKTAVLVDASAGERHAMQLHLLRGRAPVGELAGVED
ncbi:MAG: DEAD/DEAH box helicase [Xanthomonadales bacterium]|nr:DEAD/DEAH box helicase [Xanthomonadales bacterium]